MADNTGNPTSDDEQQTPANTEATSVKRRLRAPETMRERTEKLQNVKDKSGRTAGPVRLFFRGFFWPLRWIGRQISKLGRFKVFRILGLILLPRYIRNSWKELRQVTWPTVKQSIRLTYAVLIFSVSINYLSN
jgi:hypothetical protein